MKAVQFFSGAVLLVGALAVAGVVEPSFTHAQTPAVENQALLLGHDELASASGEQIYQHVCQGCHMTLPPQQVNEVRRADKLNLCPTCQRILYIKEQEDESVGQ